MWCLDYDIVDERLCGDFITFSGKEIERTTGINVVRIPVDV